MASKRAFLATSVLTASWLMGSSVSVAQAPIDPIAPEAAAPTPPVAEPVMAVPAAVVEAPPEPAPVAEAAAPLQVQSAEAFIDRSDYSLGATERENVPVEIISREQPAGNSAIADVNVPAQLPIADQVAEAAPSVQIGSLNLSSSGIGWQPEPPASVSVVSPGKSYLDLSLIKPLAMASQNLINMVFPVAVPAPITSLFGWRIHPISGTQKLHTGTDIGAPMGTPVMAAMPGRVILADDMGGYGLTVAIEHDNGVRQTLYAHMSQLFVRPGDVVQQGTVIGRVGSTGASTGAHLHFELRQMMPDGTWVAMDAGQPLEAAVSSLTRSLQLAQQPKTTAMQPTKPAN
jgi:murein DD-endopeptidase MepM/ murein hydrolase activator NlpD